MSEVIFEEETFELNDNGFLVDINAWNGKFARCMGLLYGIGEFSDDHWKVIKFVQDYYKKNGIAPMVRILTKVTGFKLKHLYELFPAEKLSEAICKIAGLHSSAGCA